MNPPFVVAPLLVALVGAVVTLALRSWSRAQVAASVAAVVAYAIAVSIVAWHVVFAPNAAAAAYQLGDWDAPYGITLVADALSAFMLVMVAAVALASLVFSTRYVAHQRSAYHPLFHFLLLGVSGAFLTGDLFNLFVWFEVTLMASYAFVAFYGGGFHTRAALRYVVLNVVASSVMLVAIGGLYATTGTLNMADMARRLADPAAFGVDPGPVVGLSALLLCVFALKAGLAPFQFWVPSAYRAAPLPVTAMFAGTSKKVGIYAIVRLSFTVFATAEIPVDFLGIAAGGSPLAFYGPLLFALGAASIAVGSVGAVGADSLEAMFAYSSIGQVGLMAIPVAVAATAVPEIRRLAVLAALVYAFNHALAKGLLFLVTATVTAGVGTNRLAELGGLADRSPMLASVFLVGALSLVGIPPLSGFFGKFLVLDAMLRAGSAPAVGLLLAGTGVTIIYVTRAWNLGFWGAQSPAVRVSGVDHVQLGVLVALALAVVAVGVGFEPIYRFAEAAATAAVDTEAYVDLVGLSGGDGT
ncbi:complex I subunit 5 family protein [Haloferacaceae archaeon DSL9]